MVNKHYTKLEIIFERLSESSTRILGNSITFIVVLILVIYWWAGADFSHGSIHDGIRDIILGVTFLSFFLIQKSVNKFSKALHIKINELVTSHDNARNEVANVEDKTEIELEEIAKEMKKEG